MKNIKKIINIILIAIIVFSLSKVAVKEYNYYKDNKNHEAIMFFKPVVSDMSEKSNEDSSIKNINEDYIFWINIPDTEIDYPVVQGDDNEYYLNNNFYKEESISGTIFLDSSNNINDKNLILYGHNMRNGSMFNNINYFKNEESFKDGIIKLIMDNKEYVYEIFSVFIVNGDENSIKNKFNSDDEYYEYIYYLKEKSMFNKEVENSDFSKIITLYTCSYEYDDARTIVCGNLIN